MSRSLIPLRFSLEQLYHLCLCPVFPGQLCPEILLKIAVRAVNMKQDDILEVIGDCPTFERDIKMWCKRSRKTLLFIRNDDDNGTMKCQIQF
jgi:tRNA 2-thiouridine synthesizing protein A